MKLVGVVLTLMCCQVFGLPDEQQAIKDAYKPSDCEKKHIKLDYKIPGLELLSKLGLVNWKSAEQSSELYQLIVNADFYVPGKPLLVTLKRSEDQGLGKIFLRANDELLGTWSTPPCQVSLTTCSKEGDAIVSSNLAVLGVAIGSAGGDIHMVWTPERDYGEVTFKATILATNSLYQIQSKPISSSHRLNCSSFVSLTALLLNVISSLQ